MKIIGITGPTGAGKTTVLSALAELGGAVIDCDAVYHRLLETDAALLEALRRRFGEAVFTPGGTLDRKALGRVVFADPAALADLNAITHPCVDREVDALLARARAEGRPAAAVDAIALLESGLREKCHTVVAVIAPPEVRIARIMAREGIVREYAASRVAAQRPNSYFEANCPHVFVNDCPDAQAAKAKALALFQTILKEEIQHE